MAGSEGAVGTTVEEARLVIGGVPVSGAEAAYPVNNPALPDEVVLLAPSASPAQVDAPVGAARGAQPRWPAVPFQERAARLPGAGRPPGPPGGPSRPRRGPRPAGPSRPGRQFNSRSGRPGCSPPVTRRWPPSTS